MSSPALKKPAASAANPHPTPSPAAPKTTQSSSDEEDVGKEEEEEEGAGAGARGDSGSVSDSDSDALAKPSKLKPKGSLLPKPPSSDSESNSESDSDAAPEKPAPPRRPSRGPDPSIKPISSKPMDVTPTKPKKTPPATAAAADMPKSPASETATKKRKRKVPEAASGAAEEEDAANGPSGKKLFQRLWTEDDEIAVLKGMIEYQAKHGGADPSSPTEIGPFHELIRKTLHMEFSKSQLSDKIRRLKKKYATKMRRGKKGSDPSVLKTHERAAFELSKKIWAKKKGASPAAEDGDGGGDEMEVEAAEEKDGGKKGRQKLRAGPVLASPRKARSGLATPRVAAAVPAPALMESPWMNGEDWEGKGEVLYPKLKEVVAQLESENAHTAMKGSFKKALELLEPSKVNALEDKWNRQCLAEMKLFFSRSELTKELVGALVEALDAATS